MTEAARKIMHEFKARALEVSRVEELTASMRRIFLRGDLDDFPVQQFAPTQHVRLVLPEADGELLLPTMVAGRPRVEGDRRPITRDYTVRGYRDGELIIDIATGHNGPASRWAQTAVPGSRLGVCGPRGSLIMPTYDSYVLVADEAAVPSLSRWCEEAPEESRLRVFVVADAAFAQVLPQRENIEMTMGTVESVLEALATTPPTVAEYLWAAGEISLVRAVRGIAQEAGIPADQQHLNGYWRAGQENYDHHQPLDAD